jgi:hypothetical protein
MKTTDKQLFEYRNILEYVDGEYIITNKISDHNIKEMRLNMTDSDAEEFDSFVERNWGKESVYRFPDYKEKVSVAPTSTKKRGRKPKQI